MDQVFVRRRLNELIEERGLSHRKVSMRAEMGDQRLRNFLIGKTNKIKAGALAKVLEVLKISKNEFFKYGGEALDEVPLPHEVYRVPIYGEIPAGNPTWIEGNQTPTDYVLGELRDKRRNAFALRVSGDSMAPRYLSGDVLFLRPLQICLPIKNPRHPVPRATFDALVERTVAVLINGEATLKKIRIEPRAHDDYQIHLVPINQVYASIVIKDTDEVRFQGEVYKTVRDE